MPVEDNRTDHTSVVAVDPIDVETPVSTMVPGDTVVRAVVLWINTLLL